MFRFAGRLGLEFLDFTEGDAKEGDPKLELELKEELVLFILEDEEDMIFRGLLNHRDDLVHNQNHFAPLLPEHRGYSPPPPHHFLNPQSEPFVELIYKMYYLNIF